MGHESGEKKRKKVGTPLAKSTPAPSKLTEGFLDDFFTLNFTPFLEGTSDSDDDSDDSEIQVNIQVKKTEMAESDEIANFIVYDYLKPVDEKAAAEFKNWSKLDLEKRPVYKRSLLSVFERLQCEKELDRYIFIQSSTLKFPFLQKFRFLFFFSNFRLHKFFHGKTNLFVVMTWVMRAARRSVKRLALRWRNQLRLRVS